MKLPVIPSLNVFAKQCCDQAVAKGWHEAGLPPLSDQLFLVVSELAEAGEEYRAGRPLTHVYPAGQPAVPYGVVLRYHPEAPGLALKPEGFGIELADALIRIGHLAHPRNVDLDDHVASWWSDMASFFQRRNDFFSEGFNGDDPAPCDETGLAGPLQAGLADLEATGSPLPLLLDVAQACAAARECSLMTPEDFSWEPGEGWDCDDNFRLSPLGVAAGLLFVLADRVGVDLMALAELKMAYNATRPHRHGGKVA